MRAALAVMFAFTAGPALASVGPRPDDTGPPPRMCERTVIIERDDMPIHSGYVFARPATRLARHIAAHFGVTMPDIIIGATIDRYADGAAIVTFNVFNDPTCPSAFLAPGVWDRILENIWMESRPWQDQ